MSPPVCSDPFIDVQQMWEAARPHPSDCFLYSIVTFPCVVLWLLAAPYLRHIYRSRRPLPIPPNILNRARLVLALVMALAAACDLGGSVYAVAAGQRRDLISFISPGVLCATLLLVSGLLLLERRFAVITSPVNFLFILLLLLTLIVHVYSTLADAFDQGYFADVYRASLLAVLFLCCCGLLILLSFSDYDPGTMGLDLRICELSRASVLSQVTFWWLNKLVYASYKKDMQEDDVFQLRPEDSVEANYRALWNKWSDYKRRYEREGAQTSGGPTLHLQEDQVPIVNAAEDEPQVETRPGPRRPHLFRVLAVVFGPGLVFAWLFKFVYDIINFVNPLLLRMLIDFTQDRSQPAWHGALFATIYILIAVASSACFHQNFHFSLLIGMRIRSALTAAIYRKALHLSNEARAKSTVGEIVNLMSVDAQRLCDCLGFLWFFWSTVLQIVICISLLWTELQVAVLAGVGVLVFFVPINGVVMSKLQKYEEKEMEWKDKRVKLLTEVLNGMKILKLYAWEPSFEERVGDLRRTELSYTRKVTFGWAFIIVVWSVAPYLVTLASFAAYIYGAEGHVLTAQRAFVSLTLFNMLRFPMTILPWGVSTSINAYVSLKRLNGFFNSDDLESSAVERRSADEDGPAVSMEQGTFSWTKEGEAVLREVDLEIPKGSLVAVVGRVGCGKSSLVSAVLGEMHKVQGRVATRGSIAYVPQQAWIQHMSVQDNILFGSEMERLWYEKVLDACALRADLRLLHSGDQTVVGERGITLSGGQKQRVGLARAVYQRADLYLLDDPLSAVDAHVGRQLFEAVVGPAGLLAGRTRLLVTHGLQWLPQADRVLVVDSGRVAEAGTFAELNARPDGLLARLLREEDKQEQKQEEEGEEEESVVSPDLDIYSSSMDSDTAVSPGRLHRYLSRQRSERSERSEAISEKSAANEEAPGAALVEEEALETGHVSWSAYGLLLRSRGLVLTFVMLASYFAFAGLNIGSSLWLTRWSDDATLNNASAPNHAVRDRTDMYMGYYGLFGVGQTVVVTVYACLQAVTNIQSSMVLHTTMLRRILRAPMAFFDTTPIGRIINRFSKDMETIDHEIPGNLNDFIECLMAVLSSVIVVSYTTPLFLAAIVPLVAVYFVLQMFYIPVSRQSRRLDSVTRSPIFTHFTESVVGAPVIRAFAQVERFSAACDQRVDNNARFFFVKVASNRWLGFRLELIGCLVVFCAILMAVLGRDALKAGLVGLSISYALQVTDNLNWMVRQITELETNAVAVERVQDYSNVDQEAAWEDPPDSPTDASWPAEGHLRFRRFALRYREGLPLVLRGVDAAVRAGERVGIVGRTGAGKSSLTLALFRLVEAADGAIEVDRRDVAALGLHRLRRGLAILPQEPTLFSGSLRDNLDPFAEHEEAALWRSLDLAHLGEWARGLVLRLEHEVGEGGGNLSVGQRQLVCLARALLRRSRVLVLDEATAAVDLETDRLVMETVREQFRGCTILIIAHRLATIMDCDRVMVLDQGRIREFDSPATLLRNKEGLFYSLAETAGLVAGAGADE